MGWIRCCDTVLNTVQDSSRSNPFLRYNLVAVWYQSSKHYSTLQLQDFWWTIKTFVLSPPPSSPSRNGSALLASLWSLSSHSVSLLVFLLSSFSASSTISSVLTPSAAFRPLNQRRNAKTMTRRIITAPKMNLRAIYETKSKMCYIYLECMELPWCSSLISSAALSWNPARVSKCWNIEQNNWGGKSKRDNGRKL